MVGAIRQGFYRGFCKNSNVHSKSSCKNFPTSWKNAYIISKNLKELLKVWYYFASKMLDFRVWYWRYFSKGKSSCKNWKVLARGLHYRVRVIPFQWLLIDSSFNNLNPVPSIIDKKFFQYYRYFKLKVYKYLGMVGAIRQGFYRGFCKNSNVHSKSSCKNFPTSSKMPI